MEPISLNLSLLNAAELQTSLRRRSIANVLECTLDRIGGLPQHTKAILHTSVSRGATAGAVRRFPSDDVNGHQVADMDSLVSPRIRGEPEQGVVAVAVGVAVAVAVRLTAVATLRVVLVPQSPAEVPEVLPGVAFRNMTILELLLSLEVTC